MVISTSLERFAIDPSATSFSRSLPIKCIPLHQLGQLLPSFGLERMERLIIISTAVPSWSDSDNNWSHMNILSNLIHLAELFLSLYIYLHFISAIFCPYIIYCILAFCIFQMSSNSYIYIIFFFASSVKLLQSTSSSDKIRFFKTAYTQFHQRFPSLPISNI